MNRTKDKAWKRYRIELVDRILDPVHGFIDVTQPDISAMVQLIH